MRGRRSHAERDGSGVVVVVCKLPNEEACARIMQTHSRKMNCSPDVN